jgi:hypothetical protein
MKLAQRAVAYQTVSASWTEPGNVCAAFAVRIAEGDYCGDEADRPGAARLLRSVGADRRPLANLEVPTMRTLWQELERVSDPPHPTARVI